MRIPHPFIHVLASVIFLHSMEGAAAASIPSLALAVQWRQYTTSVAYHLDAETGALTHLGDTGYGLLNSLARTARGELYSVGYFYSHSRYSLIRLDPQTGRGEETAILKGPAITLRNVGALAFAPSGNLYGMARGGEFFQIDLRTATLSVRGLTTHGSITSLAFGPGGRLFGWSHVEGLLVLDPATATTTRIGTQTPTIAIQSIAFAPSGKLYGVGGFLYSIDTLTGIATMERQLPDYTDLRGMEFIVPEPASIRYALAIMMGTIVNARRKRKLVPRAGARG